MLWSDRDNCFWTLSDYGTLRENVQQKYHTDTGTTHSTQISHTWAPAEIFVVGASPKKSSTIKKKV